MNIHQHDIGVCSWSLQTKTTSELISTVRECGLSHLQLAVAPILSLDATGQADAIRELQQSGLILTATMIHFPGEDYSSIEQIHITGGYLADTTWASRKELTAKASQLTRTLGIKYLTTHIGFVPGKTDIGYLPMLDKIREICGILKKDDVTLLLETGQERAHELLDFLSVLQVDNVGVNFDPANMIMYGAGDPINAIDTLAKFIRHVHIKDGVASDSPGKTWGSEVAFGTGQVGPDRFINALKRIGYTGPLVIEREAGDQRIADVKAAIDAIGKAKV